jgi:hypothetical protein
MGMRLFLVTDNEKLDVFHEIINGKAMGIDYRG